jgi:hypothetical protein
MRHVLHLMQPDRPGAGRRSADKADETGRGPAPGDTPQRASELNQTPVVRDFLIVQMPDARYVARGAA